MVSIAAIQASSSDDIDSNLSQIEALIETAVGNGGQDDQSVCKMIVLPECFGFMQSSITQLLSVSESEGDGKIQGFLSQISRKYNIWIIGGSIPLKSTDKNRVTNTQLVYDDQGNQVARYDKIFLFDVSLDNGESYRESDYTMAGNKQRVIDSPAGKVGLSICYDLRFPELYRQLTDQGAEVLVVPSAFAFTTGRDHWLPLLQARAIENFCYLVAPAQFGVHNNKRKTWGHTVIIDPWGKVINQIDTGWGCICAEIDLWYLRNARKQLPSLDHRRKDLF